SKCASAGLEGSDLLGEEARQAAEDLPLAEGAASLRAILVSLHRAIHNDESGAGAARGLVVGTIKPRKPLRNGGLLCFFRQVISGGLGMVGVMFAAADPIPRFVRRMLLA